MAGIVGIKVFTQELRKAGFVPTRQRTLILRSLKRRKDHPDVEMVLKDLRGNLPSLSMDTVYRTLHAYAGHGLIQRLALPVSRAHFDGNADPHDHFMCTGCKRVLDLDVPDELLLPEVSEIADIASIQAVQRVLLGQCRDCTDIEPAACGNVTNAKYRGRVG